MYRITKQKFGTNKKTVLFKSNFESKPLDFCCAGEYGFVIIFDNLITSVTESGQFKIISDRYDGLSSVCYNKYTGNIYVSDIYGTNIRRICMGSDIVATYNGKNTSVTMSSLFYRYDGTDTKTDIDISSKGLIYVNSFLNRCLLINTNSVEFLLGNGHSGYSISNKMNECQLRFPCGVAVYDEVIYVCDTGNHCIRTISGDNTIVVAGRPNESGDKDGCFHNSLLDSPSSLSIDNDIGYFIDVKKVKYLSLIDNSVGSISNVDNPISVCIHEDKSLVILEEI